MNRVSYSHYGVTQKQIVNLLQAELNQYKLDDVGQILNNRTIKIQVTLDHPLMVLAGAILFSSGANLPDINGMFPRISVTDASHREKETSIGQGIKDYSILKTSDIQNFKNSMGSMKDRIDKGLLITNQQVDNMLAITESIGGEAILMRQQVMQDVTYYISVWCLSIDERIVLTQIMESTLFGLKQELIKQGFRNPQINTDTGITNSNFGRMIFGSELELTGINTITNYTLFKEKPLKSYNLESFPNFLKFGDENFEPYRVWSKEDE
jgi:hypothetical protein